MTPAKRKTPRTHHPGPLLDPMAMLDETHREVMLQLEALRRLASQLDGNQVSDSGRLIAKSALEFFGNHARQHHADEEALIFPGLLARGEVELTQQVNTLQQDHGWLEQDWRELEPMLSMLADGFVGLDQDALRFALDVFATLYHSHITFEETLIYPRAKRLRAAEQAAQTRRLEDSTAGD